MGRPGLPNQTCRLWLGRVGQGVSSLTQRRILKSRWSVCPAWMRLFAVQAAWFFTKLERKGGTLLYSTCSAAPHESVFAGLALARPGAFPWRRAPYTPALHHVTNAALGVTLYYFAGYTLHSRCCSQNKLHSLCLLSQTYVYTVLVLCWLCGGWCVHSSPVGVTHWLCVNSQIVPFVSLWLPPFSFFLAAGLVYSPPAIGDMSCSQLLFPSTA